jgi:hypothetical protein
VRVHQITTFSRGLFLTFVAALLSVQGCATSAASGVSKTPLTADEARAFEHGVDFIATLGGLEGRWRDEWDKDLNVRVGSADAIAIVTVKTQRTDIDPQQRVTHRLFAAVDRVLLGETRGNEVELSVREGVPGFMSVDDNLARIQGQAFVAYLKWYQEEGGRVSAHWHLSPASSEIVSETEQTAGGRRAGGKPQSRGVVHEN